MSACSRCRGQGGRAFPGVPVACSRAPLNHVGRVRCVGFGLGACRKGCMWVYCSGQARMEGVVKWVLRGGRGVDADPEVRVRFPTVVMEVVGLWGHSWAGYRPER